MRNFIVSIFLLIASLHVLIPVQAQIEVQPYEIIMNDPSIRLFQSDPSLGSSVFHTVDLGLYIENTNSLPKRVIKTRGCQTTVQYSSVEWCVVGLKRIRSSDYSEFVEIQYDQGEVFEFESGVSPFTILAPNARLATRFTPKTSSDDTRDVRIDRIWLAPYFDNQFGDTNLPPSAPRDLTVYIYSDFQGRPDDVLFSKVVDDPRDFTIIRVGNLELDFFELDLSNEGIGILPDVIHIAYGNAGNDENFLTLAVASYATENVSHLNLIGEWGSLWEDVFARGENLFNETVIPIRARFRLDGLGGPLQFVQQVPDQSYSVGQAITPLTLPEATGGESPISYSLMPQLPAGLNFDSSSRTIRGTPSEATSSPVEYIYTATDAGGNIVTLQFTIEVRSSSGEIVYIQYDEGKVSPTIDGGLFFGVVDGEPIFSTTFVPKRSLDDEREVQIERIWLSPYFSSQFRNSPLPSSAPRDLVFYIYSDDGGRPGDVLFSKKIDDPRDFTNINDLDLDFFELDLSNEGIGILPDITHIAYSDAGDDENFLVTGFVPYATENVSHIFTGGRWRVLWTDITVNGQNLFNWTMIPIRAEFRLLGEFPVQVSQETTVPEGFVVHGNYPNPFQRSTNLQFDLPASARVSVEVIDILGRKVLTVPPVDLSAGWGKQIEVDGQSLPSGHYLYRIVMHSETGNSTQTGQFIHFR